jgi:hypothetical protein
MDVYLFSAGGLQLVRQSSTLKSFASIYIHSCEGRQHRRPVERNDLSAKLFRGLLLQYATLRHVSLGGNELFIIFVRVSDGTVLWSCRTTLRFRIGVVLGVGIH